MKRTLRYSMCVLVGYAASSVAACGGGGTTVSEDDAGSELGKAICKWLFECECDTSQPDQETCEMYVAELVGTGQDAAKEAELKFDGSCIGSWIDDLDSTGCDAASLVGDYECSTVCKSYYGDKGDGESCSNYSAGYVSADDCQQGLVCGDRDGTGAMVCYDPCEILSDFLGEGDDCDPTMEPFCDPTATMCDPMEMKCVALPDVGEACPLFQCRLGAWCDFADPMNAVCVAQKGSGEACMNDIECETYSCPDGTCAEGEPQVCGLA